MFRLQNRKSIHLILILIWAGCSYTNTQTRLYYLDNFATFGLIYRFNLVRKCVQHKVCGPKGVRERHSLQLIRQYPTFFHHLFDRFNIRPLVNFRMKTHSQLRENRYLHPFILLKHRFILIPDSHKRCIFTPSMETIFNFNHSLQCHHCITDRLHSDLHHWVTACSIVKLYWASDTAVHGHKAAQYADISRQKAAWAEPRQALSLCVFHWPKTMTINLGPEPVHSDGES